MKTYYIYEFQSDEFIGTIEANSISEAEKKAQIKFSEFCDPKSDNLVAFSERY